MKRTLTLAVAMAACLAISSDSYAQRPGGGSGGIGAGGGFGGGGLGGGGGFGGGGLGGGMGGGGLGGGRGLGGGLGGGGLGGGLGGGGLGGGLGQGGFGGGQMGGLGMQGQMGFGSGRNQNFVGTDSADLAAMFQGMAAGAQGMAGQNQSRNRGGGQQRGGQQGGRGGAGGQGSSEQATAPMRVRLQVAFDYPLPSTTPGGPVAFEPTQYDRILEGRQVENFAINRVGSRVVITGVAANASERLLMEKLVSLEPGVTEVENQMTVVESLGGPIPPE